MSEKVKTPFLRPNLQNQGEVPPEGELCMSPDIWCAGIHPVADFEKTLATDQSYGTLSAEPLVENKKNYFYVRCKNGSDTITKPLKVRLYWTKASIICWPYDWKELDFDIAKAGETNSIGPIEPGAIGVVQAPFVWDLHNQPASKDEYCFIAQLESEDYPNPKPSTQYPIYIASMLENGLLWAEQNIHTMEYNPDIPITSFTFGLPIPLDATPKNNDYLVVIRTKNLGVGWEYQVQASRTDSSGKQIGAEKSKLEDLNLIGDYTFLPGFFSQITVLLYNRTGAKPAAGSYIIAEVYNKILPVEVALAKELNAYNPKRIDSLRSVCNSKDDTDFHPILMGSYSAVFK